MRGTAERVHIRKVAADNALQKVVNRQYQAAERLYARKSAKSGGEGESQRQRPFVCLCRPCVDLPVSMRVRSEGA